MARFDCGQPSRGSRREAARLEGVTANAHLDWTAQFLASFEEGVGLNFFL
jgi:hypothetical protein